MRSTRIPPAVEDRHVGGECAQDGQAAAPELPARILVAEGEDVRLEKLDADPGSSVEFSDVLLIKADENIHIGRPVLQGALVSGTVAVNALGDKVLVFKYKAKKQYRRTRGHRQQQSEVRIEKINIAG